MPGMPRSAATRAAAANSQPAAPAQVAVALVGRDLLDGRADREEEVLAARAHELRGTAQPRGERSPGRQRGRPVGQEECEVDELEPEQPHDADALVLARHAGNEYSLQEMRLAAHRSGTDTRAGRGRADEPGVLREDARGIARRRVLDDGEPRSDLVVGQLDVEPVRLGVDLDDVPVAKDRERPAGRRLGRDVPDRDPLRAAAEPAVGEERDLLDESRADDRAR